MKKGKEKKMSTYKTKKNWRRMWMCVSGAAFCGISVGMFKVAAFGIDPFQVFMNGIYEVYPITFGTLYALVNLVLLMFAFCAGRRYIGLGTIVNLLFLGYIADFVQRGLEWIGGEIGMFQRLVLLILAVILNGFSAALYFSADMGVSPYDSISLIITNEWKKGKFKSNRIVSDVICVGLGIILSLFAGENGKQLGGNIGIGTVITMFFMGPMIAWFREKYTERMIGGE